MDVTILIVLLVTLVSYIPLIWFFVHLREFWRTKNAWSISSALIFLLSFILIITGLITLFISAEKDEYIFWRFALIVTVGLAMTGFGALVRFILRLTNRVQIDKKKQSLLYRSRQRRY
jgi:hypothetical protein